MGKTVAEKVTEKQQENETVVEKVTVVENKSKAWIWSVIIVLLIIVLASIGAYLLKQLNDTQENQKLRIINENQRISELTTQINSIQSELASTQKQLTSVDEDVMGTDDVFNKRLAEFSKRYDEKLEITHTDLKHTILQLQRQLGKTRGDWLMADAEYLLSVANQRLHLMGDLNTTSEALRAADQRLRESGDAAAFKVREQITKEIGALKEVAVNDIVGSYASLQLLIDRVDELTLILPYAAKPLAASTEVYGHKEATKNAHSVVNAALTQLEGLITVRHSDKEVDEILTVEEAELIKQQLSIKLEMVKIALVQKNKTLYEASVNDVLKWLDANFTKNKKTKSFITELNKLSKSQVYAELPDISLSLKMLRDITKLRIETDKALQEEEKTTTKIVADPVDPNATEKTTNEKAKENKPEITKDPESKDETSENLETPPVPTKTNPKQ
jgi:uncharacterized protein HemX